MLKNFIANYIESTPLMQDLKRRKEQLEKESKELAESAGTLTAIFENMQEGFIILDRFGVIVAASRNARNLFNSDESCVGNNINLLTLDDVFLDKSRAALLGQSGQMVLETDQSENYQVSFIPSKSPSENAGAVILITEISERQMSEKMIREFSSNVVHEIKTPLSLMAGFAEIIGSGRAEDKDIHYFAKKINNEAQRLVDVVEGISFLAKVDETEGKEVWTRFDASKIANKAVESHASIAEAARVDLMLADSTCHIYGNKQLIHAMFANLISNAILYNKPGGEVKVAVSMRNRSAYINVTDTGPGIPKEEQYKIFERFYRGGLARSKKINGVGLGLPVVRQIVRHHGGSIDIESELDKGTSVFVKLPQ